MGAATENSPEVTIIGFVVLKSNKENYGRNRVSAKKSCIRQGLSNGQELEEGGQKRTW